MPPGGAVYPQANIKFSTVLRECDIINRAIGFKRLKLGFNTYFICTSIFTIVAVYFSSIEIND